VRIDLGTGVTYNDPALTRRMLPTLQDVAGDGAIEVPRTTTAEDFSVFQEKVPGLFVFLGVAPDDPALVHPNHSPRFYADERALPLGVEVITRLAVDYLEGE
jgi:Metal-dependent amidase/aminoacylase/carboxypeptidase